MKNILSKLRSASIMLAVLMFLLTNVLFTLLPSPASAEFVFTKQDLSSILHHTPNYDPNTCTSSTSSYTGSGDLDKLQKVFAFRESGGSPTIGNSAGAKGKYQYIDTTWRASAQRYYGPASQYSAANAAPEAVQDAVFHLEYTKKFKDFNNDIFKIIVSHYLPAANENPALLDIVPAPEAGNTTTPRQYADETIADMGKPGPWDKIELHYKEAPEFDTWLEKVGGAVSTSAGQTSNPTSTTTPTPGSSSTGATTTPTSGNNQSVYILGDSILDWFANADAAHAAQYGVPEKGLEKKLKEGTWQPSVSAKGGRQLSGKKYVPEDGLAQIETDQLAVKNADVVVIALGTNRDDTWTDNTKESFRQHVDQAVDRIKALNKNAAQVPIYWVNLAYAGATLTKDDPGSYPYDQSFNDYNSVLQEESSKKAFNIIDWKAQVTAHADYIKTDDPNLDGYAHVHPSPGGTTAYTQLIVDALASKKQQTTTGNGKNCAKKATAGTAGVTEVEYEDATRPTPGVGASRKIKVKVWGADGQAKPLVVFAHGWKEGPNSYKRYIEALASKGFVVAAPSFPLADKDVDGDKINRDNSLPYQAGDLSFVTGKILEDDKFKDKIDPNKIGIVGHSDGAMAVLRDGFGSNKDGRVKAVLAISADNIASELGSGPPVMIIHGDSDSIASYDGDKANYNALSVSPRYFVTMVGADHFEYVAHTAADTPALDAISAAFFKNQLDGGTESIETLASSQFGQITKVEKQ